MALKSIYTIDVDDAAFKAFKSAFDEHNAGVNALPGAWRKAGAAMKAATDAGTQGLKSEAELIAAMAVGLSQVVRHQSELTRVAGNTNGAFRNLLQTTKGVLQNVTNTTFEFLKWGALGIFSVGAAGAYAFGRSATAGSNLRAQSGVLGVRAGQLNAARDVYGPMLGGGTVEGILANIAAAQSDPTKWRALAALGIDPQSGQSPGDLLPQVLSALGQKYRQFGGKAPLWNAAGLDIFGDVGIGRLLNQRQGDLSDSAPLYRTTSQTLEPGDANLRTLQDARVRLDIFKTRLENIFLGAFSRLDKTGSVDKAEDAIAKMAESFANNPHVGEEIDNLAKGISRAAVYLGSKQFADDVTSIIGIFHKLAHPLDTAKGWWDQLNADAAAKLAQPHATPGGDISGIGRGIMSATDRATLRAMTEIAEQKYGLPKGLMWGIAGRESSYGANLGPSSAGAMGIFQDMPGTLRQYGIHLGSTPSEVEGNAKYLRDLIARHGGNVDAALADFGGLKTKNPSDYISDVYRRGGVNVPQSATPRVAVTVTTHHTAGSDGNQTAAAMVH